MIAERLRRAAGAAALVVALCASGCARSASATAPQHLVATSGAERPLRVVVLGDSLAMGTGAADPRLAFAFLLYLRALATHPGSEITNFAIGGTNLGDVARLEVPRLRGTRADIVLLCAGGNDIVERTSAAAFTRSAHALIAGIRRASTAPLVVVGIPDVAISPLFSDRRAQTEALVRRDGAILRATARTAGASYVDLAAASVQARRDPSRFLSADEFHPSSVGHAAIAAAVWPAFKAAAARRGMAAYAGEAPRRRNMQWMK